MKAAPSGAVQSIRLRNNCLQHDTTTKYLPEANKDQTKQLANYQINYQLHGNLDINKSCNFNKSINIIEYGLENSH